MNILVAYATAHGSTHQVADAIAARLTAAGLDVTVRAAGDVTDVAYFDAVVLGSAVHNGRWLTPAADLAKRLRDLPARPLWLFSVCTIGETTSFLGPRLSSIARRRRPLPEVVEASGAPHRYFAGVIEKDHWNLAGSWFFTLTGGHYGDHRDWADIDAWADAIAAELAASFAEEPAG
jgi:menaquinone-dependent protoporphyrinogen oxidase